MTFFESREDMLSYYLCKNLVGAEIGVFEGSFSDFLLTKNPKKLYLVDIFEGVCGSGDVDGNNFKYIDLSKSFINLNEKYKENSNITLFKGASSLFFSTISDDFLDYIYIDGDHSYSGVLQDLEHARLKIKSNGYIFGHDYSINQNKTKEYYSFGVKQAVDEFCVKYNLCVESLANDGCTSFCIKNRKLV